MVQTERRPIYFTNDIDGVHRAGFSLRTALRLLRGNLQLPPTCNYFDDKYQTNGLVGRIEEEIALFYHRLRSGNPDAADGLRAFQEAATMTGRDISLALLFGREPYKHDLTFEQFRKAGYLDMFDGLFLNPGRSSVRWKEYQVRQLVNQDYSVVHIDDDLRAGLCIGRVDEEYDDNRVLVYILRNFSNRDWLVRRGGTKIPGNIVFKSTFAEAALDFYLRLVNSEF